MAKGSRFLWMWLVSTPLVLAAEGTERPAPPTELAVTNSITMTESDEAYVSGSLSRFELTDQSRWTAAVEGAYGLSDRLRLSAELPYALVQPNAGSSARGIGDAEMALRYAALDYRQRPFGIDVGLGMKFPTGDENRDLGDGRTFVEPSFTASGWIRRVNLQLDLTWSRALEDSGDEPMNAYEYNLAVVYPVGRTYLVLEGNGETAGGETEYYVTPELVFKPSEHLEWLIAVPVGVTRAAGDFGVIAGLTYEFEHLFHRGRSDDR